MKSATEYQQIASEIIEAIETDKIKSKAIRKRAIRVATDLSKLAAELSVAETRKRIDNASAPLFAE